MSEEKKHESGATAKEPLAEASCSHLDLKPGMHPQTDAYYFPDHFDEDEEYDEPCMTCGGCGVETSDDLMSEDPLWWEGVDMITCRNCGGTGNMKDQHFF